jgi:hypothetical protein
VELFVVGDTKTLRKRALVLIDGVCVGLIEGPNPEIILDFILDIDVANHGVGVGLGAI